MHAIGAGIQGFSRTPAPYSVRARHGCHPNFARLILVHQAGIANLTFQVAIIFRACSRPAGSSASFIMASNCGRSSAFSVQQAHDAVQPLHGQVAQLMLLALEPDAAATTLCAASSAGFSGICGTERPARLIPAPRSTAWGSRE